MSSFQDVRGAMAQLVSDALFAVGVPLEKQVFDNTFETPPADPAGTYAVVNISFPQVTVETIGCEGADLIVGSCNVLLYTPKRKGMKPAEDKLLAVLKEWRRVNIAGTLLPDAAGDFKVRLATRNISGPNALAPDERPHQVTQMSCAFSARVD
jgi:hypothetical protein